MTEVYETLPQLLARAHPDGAPPGLVPVRLCPVQVFGADECDRCMAPAGYGLMDAASAWSDCNRAYGHIYRRDEPGMNRLEHETILVWVTPAEAEKFDRVLGDPRGPLPVPHVDRVQVGAFEVRMEFTAFRREDPDAQVIEQPVPIPNDDAACACRIENSGMAVLGVYPDEACPYHGDGEAPQDTPPEPQPAGELAGLVAQLQQEARGFVSEAMLHDLLYGSPGTDGKLGYILPPEAPGEPFWTALVNGPPKPPEPTDPANTTTGLFDTLGGVVPGAARSPWPDGVSRALDWALRTEESANGPLGRAKWAPAGCICPWPWPMNGEHVRSDCPHRREPAKPFVGRSAFTECHKTDGTWVHSKPHDGCPTWTRGR